MYIQDFGQLATPACTLAIGSTQTLQLFGGNVARPPTITHHHYRVSRRRRLKHFSQELDVDPEAGSFVAKIIYAGRGWQVDPQARARAIAQNRSLAH
jgi:hypothetical protein